MTTGNSDVEKFEGVLVAMSGCPLRENRDGINETTHFILASNQANLYHLFRIFLYVFLKVLVSISHFTSSFFYTYSLAL